MQAGDEDFPSPQFSCAVTGRDSCDLHRAGKELWDVLHPKTLTCSGRRQLFLLCLHQYLNTSAHSADSLMVKVSLDIFLPRADFHLPKPPTKCVFAGADGRRSCHQPQCTDGSNKGTQMQGACPQTLWHSTAIGCRDTLQPEGPRAAFSAKGDHSCKSRVCGITSSPGVFHNHTRKNRLKEKYELEEQWGRDWFRTISCSSHKHSNVLWECLPSRPLFWAVCQWLAKDKRKVHECASVTWLDSSRETHFK